MADVTRDRAQLFLVGALAVAVLFVALALLLNTAIYTENLATRNTEGDAVDAQQFRQSADRGVAGVVQYANYRENESYESLWTETATGVTDWSEGAAVHSVTRGSGVSASLESTSNGTRISHDVEGPFVSATSSEDWTLASGVSDSRDVRLNISTANLANEDDPSLFSMRFENATGEAPNYAVFVYATNSSENVSVRVVEDGSELQECSAYANLDNHVNISVSRGTIEGDSCDAFDFENNLPDQYNITIRNGTQIRGTYELFVDEDVSSVDGGQYYTDPAAAESPYVTHAIYSSDIVVEYETAAVSYSTTRTVDLENHSRRYGIGRSSQSVAGDGGGDGGDEDDEDGNTVPSTTVDLLTSPPSGEKNNEYDVEADWTAEDADDDLTTVELVLRDPDGNVQETRAISPSSSPASGTVTFENVKINGNDAGATWIVEITVFDDDGASATSSDSEVLP